MTCENCATSDDRCREDQRSGSTPGTRQKWQSLGPDAPGSFANNKQKVTWQNCRGFFVADQVGILGPQRFIFNHWFTNQMSFRDTQHVPLAAFNRDTYNLLKIFLLFSEFVLRVDAFAPPLLRDADTREVVVTTRCRRDKTLEPAKKKTT